MSYGLVFPILLKTANSPPTSPHPQIQQKFFGYLNFNTTFQMSVLETTIPYATQQKLMDFLYKWISDTPTYTGLLCSSLMAIEFTEPSNSYFS